jgi:hypothetical protein
MKTPRHSLIIGAALLAAGTAVCGQGATSVSSDTNSTPPATAAPASPAAESQSGKPSLRFEGTDLRIGGLPPITFHGFASQGFIASSDYNYLGNSTAGSFQFTELGLNASFTPFNRARIAVQAFAFDVGDVGKYEPFLDYASLEYTFSDIIGVRAGRIRRPGGIYNHIQDVDLARTSILLPQGMYDARWRDFSTSIDGGELFGSVPLGKAGSVSYETYCGKLNISTDGGVARWILNGEPGASLDRFEQPLMIGGQFWWNAPISGLRAGAMWAEMFGVGFDVTAPSGAGPSGPLVAQVHSTGNAFWQQYSLEYLWKKWTFQAEYLTYDYPYQVDQKVYSGSVLLPPPYSGISSSYEQPDCWYVSAAYRFNKWFQAGSYYTEFYNDIHHRSGSPDSSQKDLALSFRFDPTDWWILKVEGHYIRGTGLLQDDANNPVRSDNGWFMLALKTTFSF